MEQARKEKVTVLEEAWAAVVREGEKVAVRDAAGDRAVEAAWGKAKVVVAAKHRDKAADRISKPLFQQGA